MPRDTRPWETPLAGQLDPGAQAPAFDFLPGGGQMGALVRGFDWAATPLGPAAGWPQSLKTVLGLLLAARQPMFLAWGPQQTWLYNDAFAPILGRKHPAALGQPSAQVWQEAWGDLAPLFEQVFAGEAVHMDGFTVGLDRDGVVRDASFDFSYTPMRDEAAQVAGLFGVCIETTDRLQAVSALRSGDTRQNVLVALAERFRELDDPSDLSFAAAEILGRALGVSRAGYGTVSKADETISIERDWNAPGIRSLAGVLHFRDYGSYIEDLKAGRTVVVSNADLDPRTAATAGALKAISAHALVNMPVTEQGGLVALLYLNHAQPREWPQEELALIREVAERTRSAVERRRAEEDLRQLAASLEQQVVARTEERDRVWRNSRDLLVVIGADGVFRDVNPAWTAILGYRPEEVIGRSFVAFVWPGDAGLTQTGLDAALSKRNLTGFENRYLHKDGSLRWISWHTATEGELVFAYGRDVTVEKQAQAELAAAHEALRQSQKMEAVGQLTGGIAHDFNNLLAAISGSLELLSRRLADGRTAGVERFIGTAQGATRRAAALTHRLLAFSRQQTLDPRPVDANRLIAGMEDLVRRSVGPNVELEVVGAGGVWTIKVDPSQLENALLNLCINARDAMAPQGGRLTIETANKWLDERAAKERELPPGQYVSICVTDTGTGMAPEVIARAFDPFFTTKPLGEGTGLGLSMVYGFVRQSGGQVRIYSELGKGTTMCLYLPRHTGEDLPAPEPEAEHHGLGAGETVLVIDDEPAIRMLITSVLQEAGYTTLEAGEGASGLRMLQSDTPIDLLITDVGLPGGMNGRQVADQARVARPALKVLFITGFAENAVVGNGHLAHGMEVLTKPFDIEALENKVRDLIDRTN